MAACRYNALCVNFRQSFQISILLEAVAAEDILNGRTGCQRARSRCAGDNHLWYRSVRKAVSPPSVKRALQNSGALLDPDSVLLFCLSRESCDQRGAQCDIRHLASQEINFVDQLLFGGSATHAAQNLIVGMLNRQIQVETKEQHKELLEFINDMEFDRLGVFTYSPEEGTPAAAMEHQIDEEVKLDRQAELMELQQDISAELGERRIGQELLVMIEGKVADEDAYVGRSQADAPGVDGYVFVNTPETLVSGDFVRVKITGALEYDLIGEISQ